MMNEASKPPRPEGVLELDDASFAKAIAEGDPIIVDFWASWCGPCKSMHPVVESFAADQSGKVRVGRLNVDTAQATAQRLGVQSIPTFVLFSGGREIARAVGAIGADGLQKLAAQA